MTQDEIIQLAREAGFTGCLLPEEADNLIGGVFIDDENWAKPLERFAALVAAHERERVMNEPLTKGMWDRFESEVRADEREACAKMCDRYWDSIENLGEDEYKTGMGRGILDCAAAIRMRGEK